MKLVPLFSLLVLLYSCSSQPAETAAPPAQLPVMSIVTAPATTYQEFPAALEGAVNVEIRPQVDGYLERIYVDEGAFVKAGQPLFKINERVYSEQLNNAKSSLQAAQANMQREQVEIDRLQPLVANKVVSEVQLKTAKANFEAAKAAVAQAKAMVGSAQINVGYTLIAAPVSGYIGRIPFKTGSLVGRGESQPLTVLSDVKKMYAYFSMSEQDFIAFKNKFPGATLEEKVKQVPEVELVMPDNSVFEQKGRIETIEGQFDKTMGAISFRATFTNDNGTLRSGNTGKIRIPQLFQQALIVPQEATFEIQDKVFVYTVGDSNKVASKPISILGKTANYYFVGNGVSSGDKIVLSGLGNLRDGAVIAPQMISADSVLRTKSL